MANIRGERESAGYKICAYKAEDIRELIGTVILNLGRLPEDLAEVIREDAANDARLHRETDPTFEFGGGPAVELKTNP